MNASGPVATFLMGLLGSSHCAGMCGGVASALGSTALSSQGAAPVRFRWLGFHAGRAFAYTALGFAVGGLGQLGLAWFEPARWGLRLMAALCTLGVGLHMAGVLPTMAPLERLGAHVWRRVAPVTRLLVPVRGVGRAWLLGSLWAFMPCGLLYGSLAVAAASGSALQSATMMGAFACGTMPVMVGLSALTAQIGRWRSKPWVRQMAGAVVVGLGLWSLRGVVRHTLLGESSAHACCLTK